MISVFYDDKCQLMFSEKLIFIKNFPKALKWLGISSSSKELKICKCK